jgi:mono/diheme cytochrome c family protein
MPRLIDAPRREPLLTGSSFLHACTVTVNGISTPAMRILYALVLCAAACGTEVAAGDDMGSGSNQPPDGAAEFADTCATCHGADAMGTDKAPQILSPVVGYATYVVRHGRNDMGYPAPMDLFQVADLSDAQLTAILAWLDAAPRPTTGKDLYTRYCQNCHGANGRSGRVLKNIVREVNNLASEVRFGHGGTNYAARYDYMPSWTIDQISDADLTALRTYVSGL